MKVPLSLPMSKYLSLLLFLLLLLLLCFNIVDADREEDERLNNEMVDELIQCLYLLGDRVIKLE